MPGAQSKEVPKEVPKEGIKNAAAEAEANKLVKLFGATSFLTVVSGAMLFSARQAIASKQFKDVNDLTLFLTRLSSVGALMEFLLNPIIGKLADTYGRKAFLPIGNLAVMVVRLLLFFNPEKKWPLILEQGVSIPLVTSYFTLYRAALADTVEGPAFVKANASISGFIGLSVIAGPLFADQIMRRADPKFCYLLSVMFAGTSFAMLSTQYKETLPEDKRKDLVLSDMQPFSFTQLMQTRVLQRLMLATGLQSFSEGRSMNDVWSIYMKSDLGWDYTTINKFVGLVGLSLVVSAPLGKPMIQAMGMRTMTTFSNACNMMSLLAAAMVPPFHMFGPTVAMTLGQIIGIPGGRKRDAIESLIMKIGKREGYGNGFVSGCMMNFRAVISIIGPLMFGAAYTWGKKRNYPQLPFIIGFLTILASEGVFRSLGDDELGLDANGQTKEEKSS